MKKSKIKIKKHIFIVLAALVAFSAVMCLCSCEKNSETFIADSLDDFSGRPIGFLQGSVYDTLAFESEYFTDNEDAYYFNTDVDSFAALENGKVDCCIIGNGAVGDLITSNENLYVFEDWVASIDYAFAFAKDSPYTEPFNEAVDQLRESGEFAELYEKWYGAEDSTKVEGIVQDWPGEKGTLNYWVNTGSPPLAFIGSDGTPTGFSVDLVKSAAKIMGYRVEIKEVDFNGLIAAVQTGRADIGGRSVVVTEERKEMVDFSDPFMTDGVVLVARRENVAPSLLGEGTAASGETGIFESIADSFYKTFIEEDRWKLLAEGLLVTLCIAVLSALFGTAAGFGVYMLMRKRKKIPKLILGKINGFISGIPAVVVLMCFYYIVFQKSSLSGTAISIVSFSITFAISVYNMLILGADAVSKGQIEAAYALGVSDMQMFFSVILPQAARHVTSLYKKEFVELVKGTAIVGYIAVMDLTKITDLIRSRTFDAFFPLIAAAIIYYIVGRLFAALIGKILTVFEWDKRKEKNILKGVER